MNIFEFLGLPANHRIKEKTTMKVRNMDEVPESRKSWPVRGQIKKDGVYCHVVLKDNLGSTNEYCNLFSRTGMKFTNLGEIVRLFWTSSAASGIYLAELCNDHCSLETLSGMVNPNRVKPLSEEQTLLMQHTYLSFHDYLGIDDFIKGESESDYEERLLELIDVLPKQYEVLVGTLLYDEDEIDHYFKVCVNANQEGTVLKPDEAWVAGHKGWRMWKKVKGVDYDLLCVGAEEGTGKYKGLVANLFFEWKDGKEIKCMLGKGWTHADAEEMWDNFVMSHEDFLLEDGYYKTLGPVGKIFQVYALQESSKGKLRLPKVGELRFDKGASDVA